MWLSDTYIFVKGTISIKAEARNNPNNGDKEVVFKNFDPVTDSICEINNTPIYNIKHIDVIMSMCKLKEYCNNYSKDQKVYLNTVDMSQFSLILVLMLIFRLLITVLCLNLSNNYCKMIAVDLSKQQALDPKAIQQINFTGNLTREGNANTAICIMIN